MVAKYKKLLFAFSSVIILFAAVFLHIQPVSAYAPPCKAGDVEYQVVQDGETVKECKASGTAGDAAGSTSDNASKDDDVTCAIEKVGWILCPILESMAKISDRMFEVLADNFLHTDTSLFRDDSGTKVAWEVARNLANVMFIIAFLVIIIAQVTSMGISNYGIKKMLPRLVVAAIAVNVSYYICQLVVDLTNILGYEVQNALADISNDIGPSVFGNATNYFATGGGAADYGILGVITVAALASTAVWLIIGPGIAVITVVIITVLAILVILLLRKALIVLLIVISPIAFVLYLLPNTEKYFSKWMKMFGQLLMVFPVVGLLFGAGQLASTIILVSGATTPPAESATCDPDAPAAPANSGGWWNSSTNNNGKAGSYDGKCDGYITVTGARDAGESATPLPANKGVSWTLGLVAVGVAIAPLMAVYAVLKGALSAAGAVGGAITTASNKARGAGGRWGKDRDERLAKRMQAATTRPDGGKIGKALNIASAGSYRRKAKREAIDRSLDREANLAKLGYTSNKAQSSEAFQRQLAGGSMLIPGSANEGAMHRATAGAQDARNKIEQQDAAESQSQLQAMLRSTMGQKDSRGFVIEDTTKIESALRRAIESGDRAGVQAATNLLMAMGGPGKEKIRNTMSTHGASDSVGAMDFRNHITTAHSALKSSDADVYGAASDAQARGLSHFSNDAKTFASLTNEELSKQSALAIGTPGAGGAISQKVTIVDQQGKSHEVTRGQSILASTVGDNVKGTVRNSFDPPSSSPPSPPSPPPTP